MVPHLIPRPLCLLVIAIGVLATPSPRIGTAQETKAPPQLKSRVIRFNEADMHQADWGSMHRYFAGKTFATERAYVAVAVIQPGKAVHAEHRHAEEEYLAIVEGEGTWALDGKKLPAKRGDLLYVEPWVYHGLTNTGSEPLVFLVIKYNGKGTPPPPRPDDRPDELTQNSERHSGDGSPQMTVRGTVTLDGEPLANAEVIFESPGGKLHVANSNASGTFTIDPTKEQDRLEPGEYRVIIQANPRPVEKPKASSENVIPLKYSRPEASSLRVQLAPGENRFNLELTK